MNESFVEGRKVEYWETYFERIWRLRIIEIIILKKNCLKRMGQSDTKK